MSSRSKKGKTENKATPSTSTTLVETSPTTRTTTTTTTTTTLPPTTTVIEATESSSIETILIIFVLGGIFITCIIGAYFAFKWFNKDKKKIDSSKPGKKKRGPVGKKRKPKPKKGSDEERSKVEYEDKKEFSGVLVDI